MKQIVTVVLTLLLCAGFSACSPEKSETTDTGTMPVPTLTAVDQTESALQEQVIYDAEGIRIVVKGMEENTLAGTVIRVLVENRTDRNMVFTGDLFVVNGVTVPGYLYAEVAAGTRTNDAIELYSDVLEAAGIREIEWIRGYDARLLDTDTYETIARVPMELTAAQAPQTPYAIDESGVELYRDKGITVIARMLSEAFYGQTAQLLVNNQTGRDIIVEAENISVNGCTVDAWLYDTVVADTVRFCQLDLFETGLAENGIDQIESISFRLNFLDAASFEPIAQTEVLTVDVMG